MPPGKKTKLSFFDAMRQSQRRPYPTSGAPRPINRNTTSGTVKLNELKYLKIQLDNAKRKLEMALEVPEERGGGMQKVERELDGMISRGLMAKLASLSFYDFAGDEEYMSAFVQSKVRQSVKAIADCELFRPVLSAMATELDLRWRRRDFVPRPLDSYPAEPTPEPEGLWELSSRSPTPSASTSTSTITHWTSWSSTAPRAASRIFRDSRRLLSLPSPEILATHAQLFRGLARGRNGTGAYRLTVNTRPSNVFGDNGLAIGTWWPYREALRRDGGHGAVQAGIYGTQVSGAYSIVTSGGSQYEELDEDLGDILYYSGSLNSSTLDENIAIPTSDTNKLMRSKDTGNPVRVIRGKGDGEWAPSAGYRYDGLYYVVECVVREKQLEVTEAGIGKRLKKVKYFRFRMVRKSGQEPLKDVTERSPSDREKAAYLWDLDRIGKL